jgi:hypothetical protein
MCLDGSTKCMAVKLKKLDSDVQASATAHHTKNSCEPLDSLHIEWYITYTLALHLNSAGAYWCSTLCVREIGTLRSSTLTHDRRPAAHAVRHLQAGPSVAEGLCAIEHGSGGDKTVIEPPISQTPLHTHKRFRPRRRPRPRPRPAPPFCAATIVTPHGTNVFLQVPPRAGGKEALARPIQIKNACPASEGEQKRLHGSRLRRFL